MHEAQRSRNPPEALLAHDLLVAVRDLNAPAFRIDMTHAGVRGPELEPAIHLVQRSPCLLASPRQRPVRDWRDLRPLPRLWGRDDLERLHAPTRPEEPEGLLAANLEAERRRRRSSYGGGREAAHRSEERRVGKECRSRWSPYH